MDKLRLGWVALVFAAGCASGDGTFVVADIQRGAVQAPIREVALVATFQGRTFTQQLREAGGGALVLPASAAFELPGDAPAAAMQLTATATGLDGTMTTGSATVTVEPDDTVTAHITLGQGSPGTLQLSPAGRLFTTVTFGSAPAEETFTVHNGGPGASGLLEVSVIGDGYLVTQNGCNGALGGQATCPITVRHAPARPAHTVGSLVVTAKPGGTATASLDATMTPW